jgi:hypothetical protein
MVYVIFCASDASRFVKSCVNNYRKRLSIDEECFKYFSIDENLSDEDIDLFMDYGQVSFFVQSFPGHFDKEKADADKVAGQLISKEYDVTRFVLSRYHIHQPGMDQVRMIKDIFS